MKLRVYLYSILTILVLCVALVLPKKLMLIDYEYVGKRHYPKATYSPGLHLNSAIARILYNGSFVCSGVVISSEYLLTAAHCVTDDNGVQTGSFTVGNSDESYLVVSEVAYVYGLHDIAVLYGNFTDFDYKQVDFTGALINEKRGYLCGFPQGQAELMCSEYEITGNQFFFIRGVGHIFKGCSGGPLLINDTVVGVNSHVGLSSVMVGPAVGLQKLFEVF